MHEQNSDSMIYFPELSVPFEEDEHDTKMELYAAISELDPRDRLIVALISSGYTRIDGSKIVGITRNAVGRRYSESIQQLKTILLKTRI